MKDRVIPTIQVKGLNVFFPTRHGRIQALDHVSLKVNPGEVLGVVGESGCGKSLTNLALMELLPPEAEVTFEQFQFQGKDISSRHKMKKGTDIAMIFQDPMSALNPSLRVGEQLRESIYVAHPQLSEEEIHLKTIELLEKVGIPSPKDRARSYPHELSGGMAQRVMIAMALAAPPKLLIAYEPTTALDVTIQRQILELIKKLQKEYPELSIILVSHDLGVVAQYSDRIQVMYLGNVVETGPTQKILQTPQHPYTHDLLKSLPENTLLLDKIPHRLPTLKGQVPPLHLRPKGCQFHPRCEYAQEKCANETPTNSELTGGHRTLCFFPLANEESE